MKKLAKIRSYVPATLAVVSVATGLLLVLVVVVSAGPPGTEIVTMFMMGCARYRIAAILGSQIAIVTAASFGVAALLTAVTKSVRPSSRSLVLILRLWSLAQFVALATSSAKSKNFASGNPR